MLDDARVKFSDLAKECNISISGVIKRVNRLKQKGVITGTATRINPEVFGVKYIITFDLNIDNGKEEEVEKKIKTLPNLITSYRLIGKYDFHAVFYTKTFEKSALIKDTIKKIDGVRGISYTSNLDNVKFLTNNIKI